MDERSQADRPYDIGYERSARTKFLHDRTGDVLDTQQTVGAAGDHRVVIGAPSRARDEARGNGSGRFVLKNLDRLFGRGDELRGSGRRQKPAHEAHDGCAVENGRAVHDVVWVWWMREKRSEQSEAFRARRSERGVPSVAFRAGVCVDDGSGANEGGGTRRPPGTIRREGGRRA